MNIIEILKENKLVFVLDEIESKKMQTLVNTVNKNFLDMAETIQAFREYKASQLRGELHTKIVMVKSFVDEYPNWQAVTDVYSIAENSERMKLMEFNTQKAKLINSLKALLAESKNSPVVSLYDLYGQDYQLCQEGHEIIILGNHNKDIIQCAIDIFEGYLVAKGNFEMIGGIQLQANYSTVMQNAELCNSRLHSGTSKANKTQKIQQAIDQMVEIGRNVVKFMTYKRSLIEIGVREKEIQNMEKTLTKQYIPLKKYLQKELGVKFADICDIVVDEDSFAAFK